MPDPTPVQGRAAGSGFMARVEVLLEVLDRRLVEVDSYQRRHEQEWREVRDFMVTLDLTLKNLASQHAELQARVGKLEDGGATVSQHSALQERVRKLEAGDGSRRAVAAYSASGGGVFGVALAKLLQFLGV
jgi:hypothetical protein